MMGGDTHVVGVVKLDGRTIGNGPVGEWLGQ